MEEDLFKAIIQNALRDLFVRQYREEAHEWFEDNSDYSGTHITFIDACDLAGYDYKQWRYVAHLVYIGRLGKKEFLELMAEGEEIREPKYPILYNQHEIATTSKVNTIRYFKSIEEANLYTATLS